MPKKSLKKKEKKQDKARPKFDVHSDAIKAIWGVALIVLFLLSTLAFAGFAGAGGRFFAQASGAFLGFGKFVIPFALLGASYIFFTSYKRNTYLPIIFGGFLFFSGVLGIFHILSPAGERLGGYWGYFAARPVEGMFGKTAAIFVFSGLIVVSAIVVFNIKIGYMIARRREKLADARQAEQKNVNVKVKTWQEETETQDSRLKSQNHPEAEQARYGGSNSKAKIGEEEEYSRESLNSASPRPHSPDKSFAVQETLRPPGDFRLPPIELLEKETGKPSSGDIIANVNIIKRTLQNFGIEVEMGEVNVGPTVTQFTLKPAEGVKLSRIMALNNDLSLALAAHPIRIEAPIPGRSLVGVEIPNKGISIVRLKNLLESESFQKRSGNLFLAIGRDVSGAVVVANLAKMPHLLIAGSTGSGKTIALNAMILNLLYQNPPNLLKFILIDPKRVEFQVYSDIPHLLAPVVVDTQKTVNALKWAVAEMERRFETLAAARARDILSFNSNKKAIVQHGPLPYIVVVIDELADLMAARGKEIEALIVRLAQMARAVGIHLVLATQRPSVEVITGLIKANITTRVAFQVASQIDSRTVLDMSGAEKLLGNGDMLYLAGDAQKPKRVQGSYISEKEVRRVADYLREEGERMKTSEETGIEIKSQSIPASFSPSSPLNPFASPASAMMNQESFDFENFSGGSDDELYEEAKKLVIQTQKASASLLQRRLKVGYARAARMIDILEENGIVGPGDGAKPREVYMGQDEEA